MTYVSNISLFSLLWKYTYQIIILIHLAIFLYIIKKWCTRHSGIFMTLISCYPIYNTIECKLWKIFSPYLHNICQKLIQFTFSIKNVKWHISSTCCFLLCPHKFFLLLYTFPHVSHLYIFTPTTNLLMIIVISLKLKTVSHFSQHHSWKHVTCDENDENKNVYKIIIMIIIIIIIIRIIIISKPSNQQLCQKHWYTKHVSNLFWYIWWFYKNNMCSNQLNYICLSFSLFCNHDVILSFSWKLPCCLSIACSFLYNIQKEQYDIYWKWHIFIYKEFTYTCMCICSCNCISIQKFTTFMRNTHSSFKYCPVPTAYMSFLCFIAIKYHHTKMHLTSLEPILLNLSGYFTFPATPSTSIVAKCAP